MYFSDPSSTTYDRSRVRPFPETASATSTLAETIVQLPSSDDSLEIIAGPPGDPGWVLLADALASPALLDGWFDQVRRAIPSRRDDVTGSYLASFVTGSIATPLARAIVGQRRGWRLTPDATWVRVHDEGWTDGVAISAHVLVLADDPAAGRTDVEVVASIEALTTTAMEHLAALVTPLFAEVRARAPYGLRGMWGALADAMAADLTWCAHVDGRDVVDAWRLAQPLVDALARAAPMPLTRPTFEPVESDGHTAHLTIRGTCCLFYQSGAKDEPVDYCSSCPMGNEATRQHRQQQWLQRHLAADVETRE